MFDTMARKTTGDDEMRSHYDFSDGVRGKYAASTRRATRKERAWSCSLPTWPRCFAIHPRWTRPSVPSCGCRPGPWELKSRRRNVANYVSEKRRC